MPRKDPAPVGVGDRYLAIGFCDRDRWMREWQQHAVIQGIDDSLQFVSDGDEVHDILVFVQRAVDLGHHVVVVPVKGLAHIAGVGDKVRSAKNEAFLGETNVEAF